MTVEDLKRFVSTCECLCGNPKCVLTEERSAMRKALLAALDVVAVCHQGVLDGREPDTEEFVRALMAFHEAVST